MAIMLSGVEHGDEVIIPNYTFTSTANAVAIRGGTPIFVDVSSDTLNLDVEKVVEAISKKTKAIIVVHYGGVPANLSDLKTVCIENDIKLIEDAAQGIGANFNGMPLGSIGDFGCISFHATKNIQCGEGGALICAKPEDFKQAEIIREKGTDRSAFLKGEIDKYTWRELGSSYLPPDYVAAYLGSQLPFIEKVTNERLDLWNYYANIFDDTLNSKAARYISKNQGQLGNGHIFALQLGSSDEKRKFQKHMGEFGIQVSPHYVALHDTPGGLKFGKKRGDLSVSINAASGLVRLPMHELASESRDIIRDAIYKFKFEG
jgi:dTDP-4-amino-4,6-dideoxygalactose transaminase